MLHPTSPAAVPLRAAFAVGGIDPDGGGPGAYWFFHQNSRSWVVADLDAGKAHAAKRLVRLDVPDPVSDGAEVVEGCCLGQAGTRFLVRWEDAVILFREHADDVDHGTVVVYEADCRRVVRSAVARVFTDIGVVLKRQQQKLGDE